MHENEDVTTGFPDVLKAICKTTIVEKDQNPLVESIIGSDVQDQPDLLVKNIPTDEALEGTALSSLDWQNAQAQDTSITYVIDNLVAGQKPTLRQVEDKGVDSRYLLEWDQYYLRDGVLHKKTVINGELCSRLVLPESLRDLVFKAYHDDLGHQGRDRTISLISQRFFFPRMNQFIKERVQSCDRCIRRKTAPVKAANLVNITSSAPMELVCFDYLSLERSKGGYENILVITDHFSRYAQAIPTRNQTAQTTARVLFDNFFIHCGFPAKLHSDKGANFESNTIKKLYQIAGIQKTRTTPYHAMGNGMVERFNKTLLNMMGTLPEQQKSDWKAHVPTLTHAYNAAVH